MNELEPTETLAVTLNGKTVRDITLDAKHTVIGRDPTCDLQLDHPSVSRRHARVTRVLSDFYLEDLDSTNGTLLNRRRITKHVLRPADKILIGEYELEFRSREPAPDLDKTVVMRPAAAAPAAAVPGAAKSAAPQASQPASVRMLNGPDAGKTEMISRAMLSLGRAGQGIAIITRRGDGYYLLHVGGEVFPAVNDQPIGRTGVRLTDADIISVGELRYAFSLPEGKEP